MNRSRRFVLWFSFFLTATLLFFPIAFLSTLYWLENLPTSHLLAGTGIASILFSAVVATHKHRALSWRRIHLDFTDFPGSPVLRLEKELTRLGYRISQDGSGFSAGFRADYYLAPDIQVTWDGCACDLEGPSFYLQKLVRRHRRLQKRLARKIRQMTDGQTPPV